MVIGNAEEANYRSVGAAALGYGQGVVAFSPIDVNLAKQLNVLLSRLGVDDEQLHHGSHHRGAGLRSGLLVHGVRARAGWPPWLRTTPRCRCR